MGLGVWPPVRVLLVVRVLVRLVHKLQDGGAERLRQLSAQAWVGKLK